MVHTMVIQTDVPEDRSLRIVLPHAVPTGPAEIVVVIASAPAAALATLGDLAASQFFGMWRDRSDIQDSAEYAERLRAEAWRRDP
jgi:hypothetical protein